MRSGCDSPLMLSKRSNNCAIIRCRAGSVEMARYRISRSVWSPTECFSVSRREMCSLVSPSFLPNCSPGQPDVFAKITYLLAGQRRGLQDDRGSNHPHQLVDLGEHGRNSAALVAFEQFHSAQHDVIEPALQEKIVAPKGGNLVPTFTAIQHTAPILHGLNALRSRWPEPGLLRFQRR